MDPRKAATITDEALNDAFVQGLTEGIAMATGDFEVSLRVTFLMHGTALRVKHYDPDDLVIALIDSYKHLEHGEGAEVRLRVVHGEGANTTVLRAISDN